MKDIRTIEVTFSPPESGGVRVTWFCRLLGSVLMLLLAVGCSTGSEDAESPLPKEKPVLKVYVFAPEKPIVTRADIDNVDASAEEAAINTLDVWVFENSAAATNGSLVGHVHQSNISWKGQKEVAINVSDDFANRKPNVDIYVAANAGAAGLTLGASSTPSKLESAMIASDYFGLTKLISSVPVEGLPMSGLLKDQKVSGSAPVFQAQTNSGGLATVKLVRAVSKVRFIFSKSKSNTQDIKELCIKLGGKVLPKQEYLFLDGVYPTVKSNVVSGGLEAAQDGAYVADAVVLVSGKTKDDIASNSDPASFAYGTVENETAQAYEDRINRGLREVQNDAGDVTKPIELSELGRFYLRESDRKLAGTIEYKIGEEQKSPDFSMAADGDFTRNHTWIVYGYFMGNGELKLNVVDVKAWTVEDAQHKVYNW